MIGNGRLGRLKMALEESVALLRGEPFMLMFSGGLDSSVLAKCAKDCGCEFVAACAGVAGSEDLEWAGRVAGETGIEFEGIALGKADLQSMGAEVAGIVGGERMHVELGIPVYACAKRAEQRGLSSIAAGSGAEELFGGYARHERAYMEGRNVGLMLEEDFKKLMGGSGDVARNSAVARKFGVAFHCPFLQKGFIAAAREFSVEENFASGERKHVLRELARAMSVPEGACTRPKRAMQYGSGIHKALGKSAFSPDPQQK